MAIPGENSVTPATDAAAGRPRLPWRVAKVIGVVDETPRVRTLVLHVPEWPGHVAGQHVDVRLTGDDGASAQRSYSIASEPEARYLALTVERLDEGEVSPYLASEVRAGDEFELRGPIGGFFVWTVSLGGPLWLIAGGSGIVPLRAMLRHRAAVDSRIPASLLYSSRSVDDVIYRDELPRLIGRGDGLRITHTLTRVQPPGWAGPARRIDPALLVETGFPPEAQPRIYICGPAGLVESVAQQLLDLGHPSEQIRTERFGPTGP